MKNEDVAPLVDPGTAKEYLVSGLGSVTRIDDGWAEFGFFRLVGTGAERVRLIKVRLIAPISALMPAADLCVMSLGSELVGPFMRAAHRLM